MRRPMAITSIASITLLPQPLQAQKSEIGDRCTAAVASAQKRIETGRNVDVILDVARNVPELYSDYPANRPYRYTFALHGAAAESIATSDNLTKTISTTVINNCSSVSLVIFALYRTDSYRAYGLLPSGKIEDFSANCVEPGPGKLRWGQQTCY